MAADQRLRGLSWERIRAYLMVLGADQSLPGRSWGWIRAYVGGLGHRSGPVWAVLGADQGLPDGLGSGSEPTWVVLGVDQSLCGRSWERIRAKSGPGSSGKVIWAGIWVEKWPKPEWEQGPRRPGSLGSRSDRWDRSAGPDRSEAQSLFFQ